MVTAEEREAELRGLLDGSERSLVGAVSGPLVLSHDGEIVEVLVDVSAYNGTVAPLQWCPIRRLLFAGSAGVYPVKVVVPDRGEGQYAFREIHAVRTVGS